MIVLSFIGRKGNAVYLLKRLVKLLKDRKKSKEYPLRWEFNEENE